MSDEVIAAHRERQEELVSESQTLMAAADAEKRELTEDEQGTIEANAREFDRLKSEIDLRERIHAQTRDLQKPQARKVEAEPVAASDEREEDHAPGRVQARTSAPAPARPRPVGEAGRGGFRTFGDFVASVRKASTRGGEVDGRLMGAAASSYGNESSGTDGGFAVPPDYRATIMEKAFGEDSLISRTDRQTSGSNTMTFPSDMTTPWQTTGGIQAYWEGEASTLSQSKPSLQNVTVRLHKLSALVPMTEELLEDAQAMGSYVSRKSAEKIDFKISNAIAYGNGVGQPLGFMDSPALVTQAAEGGQTADTLVAANIVKMMSRMPVQSRRSAVWLIHPDAEPQLPLMTLGDQPIYMPPGGLSSAGYGTLLGRPVIPHQVCKTVGDLGDIMLVDLNSYLSVTKAGGLRSQTSIHLWFDQDITAFKFTFRVGGQPWWSEPTASLNGSHTQSPFITLAAR
ncbi:MAG: phage major capsid protein [Rhodobacteraceae bacterium]|nr:phage major capsid protein [Paracoccaceae bacterium]